MKNTCAFHLGSPTHNDTQENLEMVGQDPKCIFYNSPASEKPVVEDALPIDCIAS